jgi:phosphoribosylanthranilate isomerase
VTRRYFTSRRGIASGANLVLRHLARGISIVLDVAFKICGLTRPEDALVAEEAGASFGGVVLAPGGKRTVSSDRAAEIFANSSLRRCGVFVDASREAVLHAADLLRLDVVQLHGDETPEMAEALRAEGLTVWKAVRPQQAEDFIAVAELFGGVVDGILLDGWSPTAPGGAGARFPWEEIAPHRNRLGPRVHLIVAGGLDSGNVADAIALLNPDIVDVSSGVESAPGIKDTDRIRRFAAAVRGAAIRGGIA